MRLLPNRPEIGWTPYLWLIYIVQVPLGLLFKGAGPLEWWLSCLGLVVFLALYFRGFWLEGRKLVPVVLALAALGVVFSPFNWAAVVYFIYAAAFCAQLGPPRLAWRWVFSLALVVAIESAVFSLPLQAWASGIIFTLLIGAINTFYRERERINAKLKLAQDEVERLAKVAERERIARDLHDVLGHSLSLITLKAELAARLVRTEPLRAEVEMREVERVSRQAMAQVRETVKGYRAAGLDAELTNAKLACEAAGLVLSVSRQAVDLDAEVENALALALREAVTNVIRHAGATRVELELGGVDGMAQLRVEDDGRGGPLAEGSGLAGMRERLEALGGGIAVEVGQGLRLSIRVPLAGRRVTPTLRLVGSGR